jgi:hypothetical protein
MKIVFSLFGRPRELAYCLQSLRECARVNEFSVEIDINDHGNAANREVCEQVERFAAESGLQCTVRRLDNGFGPDRNIFRTLSRYDERVLYCAGDILFHPQCLEKYLRLNERFPNNPLSLYHSFAHPIRYEADHAVLPTFAFETLLFNPSEYFGYCLFRPFVISRISTTDWILNWLFYKRKISIFSDRFSYIQHLGVVGGNTSGKYPPRYALDYVDQPRFFAILEELGVDLNLCRLVKA